MRSPLRKTTESLKNRGLIYDYSDESSYSSFYTINIETYNSYVKPKKYKKEYSSSSI